MVANPDAIVHPRTVMVMPCHTSRTDLTVLAPERLADQAIDAEMLIVEFAIAK